MTRENVMMVTENVLFEFLMKMIWGWRCNNETKDKTIQDHPVLKDDKYWWLHNIPNEGESLLITLLKDCHSAAAQTMPGTCLLYIHVWNEKIEKLLYRPKFWGLTFTRGLTLQQVLLLLLLLLLLPLILLLLLLLLLYC